VRKIQLPEYVTADITTQVTAALKEDIGSGDITALLIDESARASATIISREAATMCGMDWADEVFRQIGGDVTIEWLVQDGERLSAGDTLCHLHGNSRQILTGERCALNFLQTLMATATAAQQFSDAAHGKNISILDTRKTLPGLRTAQKYAVLCGGCFNHRIGLYDAFLIKENHIAACGGIVNAIRKARDLAAEKKIIIEVESLEELQQALPEKPDQIMLDNFSAEMLRDAMSIAGDCQLEVSGNKTFADIGEIPDTRHLFMSSGALTKHCQAIDLSLRLTEQQQ
jgi:nicotinate-nucleotide pyrophosphorylase (carboxylating)